MRKKDDGKDFYDLWWRALTLSVRYKNFCDVLRAYADPELAFRTQMSFLTNLHKCRQLSSEMILFNEMLLWMNYKKFGDVFRSNFEEWWVSKGSINSDKITEDLEETIEREACFFVGYCTMVFKESISDENIIELLQRYIRFDKDYKFVKIRISAKDKDIRDSISRIISNGKKKHTYQLQMLKKYLDTYDLKSHSKSNIEIGKKIFKYDKLGNVLIFYRKDQEKSEPMTDKEKDYTINEYYKFGEHLIRNAEQFNFPGDYLA